MMEPQIRYVRGASGAKIAVAQVGSGPPLLITQPVGLGSINMFFTEPNTQRAIERLSRKRTVINVDWRGQGMSDRDVADEDLTLDARVADLAAVIDGLQFDSLSIIGRALAGPVVIRFAAQYPGRVRSLILWWGVARGRDMRLTSRRRALAPLIDIDYQLYLQSTALVDFGWTETGRVLSGIGADEISADVLKRAWAASRDWDASAFVEDVRCPSLVVYSRSNSTVEYRTESMRELAARIPDARAVASDRYSSYLFTRTPDEDCELLEQFLDEVERAPQSARAPGTAIILFADIVDSTALTERMGDAAFREKARDLDVELRRIISEAGGTTIDAKTLGDGVLATFPAASQAIDAALRCGAAGDEQGLPLHLGIHAGDVIREANNVFGGAVNIAARISGLSAPGEVLVSATVRELARTSAGVTFEDRGEQALKGVADAVRVFAVRRESA